MPSSTTAKGTSAGCPFLVWHRYHRANRRAKAGENSAKVGAAWLDAVEDLDLGFDLRRRPSETRTEFALRSNKTGGVPKDIIDLGDRASDARFGPDTISDLDVTSARKAANRVAVAHRSHRSIFARWLRLVDPRRFLNAKKRQKAAEQWVEAA